MAMSDRDLQVALDRAKAAYDKASVFDGDYNEVKDHYKALLAEQKRRALVQDTPPVAIVEPEPRPEPEPEGDD